ncbi:MAG: hypothetical protein ACI8S6_000256 [Myxococcota bacterium]
MSAEIEIEEGAFVARYRTERSAMFAGVGCATLLFGVTIVGLAEAIGSASPWDALVGLPCSLLFALAFAILGLARGVSRVDLERQLVVNERRFFGFVVRRETLVYGSPSSVVMDVLGRDRRAFVMISVLGDRRQAEVLTLYDFDEARSVGAQLASFLEVPAVERGDWSPPIRRRH